MKVRSSAWSGRGSETSIIALTPAAAYEIKAAGMTALREVCGKFPYNGASEICMICDNDIRYESIASDLLGFA